MACCTCGCSWYPPASEKPETSPRETGQAAIAKYDANGNARLDGTEIDKCPALKHAVKEVRDKIDSNGDGMLTADEITARIGGQTASDFGRPTPVPDATKASLITSFHPGRYTFHPPRAALSDRRVDPTTAQNLAKGYLASSNLPRRWWYRQLMTELTASAAPETTSKRNRGIYRVAPRGKPDSDRSQRIRPWGSERLLDFLPGSCPSTHGGG